MKAARIFLMEIRNCLADDNDFAFETTLSGKTYYNLIKMGEYEHE